MEVYLQHQEPKSQLPAEREDQENHYERESETLKTEKPIRSFILLVDKLVCVFGSKRMREMDSLPASPLLLSRTFPEETYIYNLSDDGCYA